MRPWVHRQLLQIHATVKQALGIYVAVGVAVPLYLLVQFAICENDKSTPKSWSLLNRLNLHGARGWASRDQWDRALPALEDVLAHEAANSDTIALCERIAIFAQIARAKLLLGRPQEAASNLCIAALGAKQVTLVRSRSSAIAKALAEDDAVADALAEFFAVSALFLEQQQRFDAAAALFSKSYALAARKLLEMDHFGIDRAISNISRSVNDVNDDNDDNNNCSSGLEGAKKMPKIGKPQNLQDVTDIQRFSNINGPSTALAVSFALEQIQQYCSTKYPIDDVHYTAKPSQPTLQQHVTTNVDTYMLRQVPFDKISMLPMPSRRDKYPRAVFDAAFGLARTLHEKCRPFNNARVGQNDLFSPFQLLFSSPVMSVSISKEQENDRYCSEDGLNMASGEVIGGRTGNTENVALYTTADKDEAAHDRIWSSRLGRVASLLPSLRGGNKLTSKTHNELLTAANLYMMLISTDSAFEQSVSPCLRSALRLSTALLASEYPEIIKEACVKFVPVTSNEQTGRTTSPTREARLSASTADSMTNSSCQVGIKQNLYTDLAAERPAEIAVSASEASFELAQRGELWINKNLVGERRRARECKFCTQCASQALRVTAELRKGELNTEQRENLLRMALKFAKRFDLTDIAATCSRNLNECSSKDLSV